MHGHVPCDKLRTSSVCFIFVDEPEQKVRRPSHCTSSCLRIHPTLPSRLCLRMIPTTSPTTKRSRPLARCVFGLFVAGCSRVVLSPLTATSFVSRCLQAREPHVQALFAKLCMQLKVEEASIDVELRKEGREE